MQAGIDYIGVTCVFICHDGTGRVLLHKRSTGCRDEHGRWDFGGGKLHHGETWEEGVRREVQEEYGTEARQIEHIYTFNALRELDGKTTHWIALVFTVLVDPTKVSIGEPDKMDELGWFRLEALPTPIHSQYVHAREAVERYFARQSVEA